MLGSIRQPTVPRATPTTGLEALVVCVSSAIRCWKMDSRLRGNDMEICGNDMAICGDSMEICGIQ